MNCVIENIKIVSFFKSNELIDMESFLLNAIDNYEYMKSSLNNNTVQILPYILNQTKMINQLMDENKSFKVIINNNHKDVQNIIQNYNNEYVNNTKNIINDLQIIMNESNTKDLKDIINNFDKRLLENNIQLINNTKETLMLNNKDFTTFTKDFELLNNKCFNDLKQYIDIVKTNTPNEFNTFFDNIIINIMGIQKSIDKTDNTVQNLSNKFLNVTSKGQISENILEIELSKHFPMYNIQRNGGIIGNAGDFIISADTIPSILIENKDYQVNVNKDEVNKFIRDIINNNMSGILISQTSGIANKQHFEIDFHGKNVAIYIHKCQYNMDLISLAIHIITSLKQFLDNNSKIESHQIDSQLLEDINKQYIDFIKNRNDIINDLNTTIKNIKKLDLPSIQNILLKFNNTLSNISNHHFICNICNKVYNSKAALTSHSRSHK